MKPRKISVRFCFTTMVCKKSLRAECLRYVRGTIHALSAAERHDVIRGRFCAVCSAMWVVQAIRGSTSAALVSSLVAGFSQPDTASSTYLLIYLSDTQNTL